MRRPAPHLAEALGHDATDKRIDILKRIGEVGSISKAARGAGISYKAAWQALETLSNLAGMPLVERAVGGSGGGGALLTQAGKRVLRAADLLRKARLDVLAGLEGGDGGEPSMPGMAALGLRTSMRNQLPCKVKVLKKQAASIRVELVLADGTSIYSRITRESAQLLGLHPGQSVLALCKATAVLVAQSIEASEGRNRLEGKVTRVSRSTGGGEIGLQLSGGLQLVGFAGPDHGLKLRCNAMACVDESGVVVAVSD